MIYVFNGEYENELKAIDKEMEWGKLHVIELGESGRGRRLISLPCPNELEKLKVGEHPELSIGVTKTGRPRINTSRKGETYDYAIISTEGGYTRRGDGYVFGWANGEVETLASGNGADGDAGRIGSWNVHVFKIPMGTCCMFGIRTAGSGYGFPMRYLFHTSKNKWYIVDKECINDFLEVKSEEISEIPLDALLRYLGPDGSVNEFSENITECGFSAV